MTQVRNQKFNENETDNFKLNNNTVSVNEINEALDNLKPNERIIETDNHNFFIVERLFG